MPPAPETDNPVDPDNPAYQPPLATLVSGPSEGQTISEAAASFSWVGQGSSSEFSFTLDGFDTDWSNWSTETTVSYTELDDQSYTFKVIERYSNADEQQSVTTRTFQVDAVTGPALVMHRRFVSTKIGLRFQVEVLVEDIPGMMGANINIAFDSSLLHFESATEGAFLGTGQHSGTVFIASAPYSANARGGLEIIATRLGGDPAVVTGSGRLALLEFAASSTGESQITFEIAGCHVRNEANQDIILNDIVHCRVVVTE